MTQARSVTEHTIALAVDVRRLRRTPVARYEEIGQNEYRA